MIVFCSVVPAIVHDLLWMVIPCIIGNSVIVYLLMNNLRGKWLMLLLSFFLVSLLYIGLGAFIVGLLLAITIIGYMTIRKKYAVDYLTKIIYYFCDYLVFLFILGVIIILIIKYMERIHIHQNYM